MVLFCRQRNPDSGTASLGGAEEPGDADIADFPWVSLGCLLAFRKDFV
jgi:hypothetical protein